MIYNRYKIIFPFLILLLVFSCNVQIKVSADKEELPSESIVENTKEKILIRTTDIQGRNCMPLKFFPYLYFYNDGTVEKKVILE